MASYDDVAVSTSLVRARAQVHALSDLQALAAAFSTRQENESLQELQADDVEALLQEYTVDHDHKLRFVCFLSSRDLEVTS